MQIDKNKIYISPSLIASDLTMMGSIVSGFSSDFIDLLHMDVMDGHFVPNLTFGPGYISALSKHTEIPFDVHLMIEKPEDSLESYMKCSPWGITIHYESTRFPARLLSLIRDSGAVAGVSINPATPVENLFDILEYSDMVLIMSVDPGFYGQAFMPAAINRIEKLNNFINKNGLNTAIQIDGGIGLSNIADVVKAGANIIVAGNSLFKGGDPNAGAKALKDACR